MTSKQAVDRIMKVLGLKAQSFFEAKTDQGMAMKMEGELEVGAPIYISTEEGMIPAPPGIHKLDDGSEIEVDEEGKVSKIKMGETQDAVIEDDKKKEDIADEDMSNAEFEFGDVKMKDGTIIRIEGDDPSVGYRVMKVGYDNTLSAVVDGEYVTNDGKVIQIAGGSIKGVQSVADNQKRKTGFAEAKDKSGLMLKSPNFEVGDEVMVVQEDGSEVRAKDQGYDIVIDDNPYTIFVGDGKITSVEPGRSAEGPEDVKEDINEVNAEQMEAIASVFAQALKKFEDKLDAIASKHEALEGKFQKFSKEPAGSKVYNQKTINEESNPLASKYEGFKRLRESMIQN
jgi:hypothetical protein